MERYKPKDIKMIGEFENNKTSALNGGMGVISRGLLCLYFVISIFEPYLNGVFGSLTKYYIILLIGVLLFQVRYIKVRTIQVAYVVWLAFKILSMLWSENLETPQLHFISQVGMIGFLLVMTAIDVDKVTVDAIKLVYCLSSGAIGLLSVFFSQPYHGVATSRQVLVLFGVEADPNNQVVLMLIGICISLFYLLYEKRHRLLSVCVLIVNTYSSFRASSRAGLVTMVVLCVFCLVVSEEKLTLKSILKRAIFVLVIFVVFYYVASNFLSEEIYNRLFDFDSYEGGSDRTTLWSNAWRLYVRDPLTMLIGAGWGTVNDYTGLDLAVHNTFLTMLCDVGIVGTMIFMIPIIYASIKLLIKKNVFPVMLLVSQLIPSFFIDAINKRFFWNAIIILLVYYCNMSSLDSAKNTMKK